LAIATILTNSTGVIAQTAQTKHEVYQQIYEPNMSRFSHAATELASRDRVMRRLVKRFGPPRWPAKPKVDQRFERLARSICGQQLAGKAAATIWGRTVKRLQGRVNARSILKHDVKSLRSAGLSRNKALAMLDLAKRVANKDVDLAGMGRRTDQQVIDELVQVRGIGVWTAQMFLMFALRRMDVWAVGDLGVRKGYMLAYDLDELPPVREFESMGDLFSPYRSVACWYFWRVTDDG